MSNVEANIGPAPNAARKVILANTSIDITRSVDHHPLLPAIVRHCKHQYRSINNNCIKMQHHRYEHLRPPRVKQDGNNVAAFYGLVQAAVAIRTTFVSNKMSTITNANLTYHHVLQTMANVAVVCGNKTLEILPTTAATRVIIALLKTSTIRSVVRNTSATDHHAQKRGDSAVESDGTALGVAPVLTTIASFKTRITLSVVRRPLHNLREIERTFSYSKKTHKNARRQKITHKNITFRIVFF